MAERYIVICDEFNMMAIRLARNLGAQIVVGMDGFKQDIPVLPGFDSSRDIAVPSLDGLLRQTEPERKTFLEELRDHYRKSGKIDY